MSIAEWTLHFACLWIWHVKLIFRLLFNLIHSIQHLYHLKFFSLSFNLLISCSLGSMLEGQCMRARFLLSSKRTVFDFWVSMAWMRFTDALADYLLIFLISRYTVFWVLLIVSKLAFSYYIEVFHLSFLRAYVWVLLLLLCLSLLLFLVWYTFICLNHIHQTNKC